MEKKNEQYNNINDICLALDSIHKHRLMQNIFIDCIYWRFWFCILYLQMTTNEIIITRNAKY